MSYARKVKEELCKIKIEDRCCLCAELEAMLKLSSEILLNKDHKSIYFISANASVSRRFLSLVRMYEKCEVRLVQKKVNKLNQQHIYEVHIESLMNKFITDFNLLSNANSKDHIINKKCCVKAYLRGAFLARGSVNDPQKNNYHLEIYTYNEHEAVFIQKLMNMYDLNAKITKRRKDLVIYLKDISSIKDFLRVIGVSKEVFNLEGILITKSVTSNVNRMMNIELANEQKTMDAAKEQLKSIIYLEYNYPLEKLDPKLLLIMKVRKLNKEASMNELIEILHNKYQENITKSGLNHRFRKIKQIAQEHEELKKGNVQ